MEDRLKIALAVFCALAVIFAFTFRTTSRVEVLTRYWVYDLRVRYTDCSVVIENKPVQTCTGSGSSRRCSTTYRIESHNECTTHTRCLATSSGETLPPIRPTPACLMYPRDYLTDDVYYVAEFRLMLKAGGGKTLQRRFMADLWDELEPGSYRYVKRNIFGQIVGMAEE